MELEQLKSVGRKMKHLGDGVYANFDDHEVWLATMRGEDEHFIALNEEVYRALVDYHDKAVRRSLQAKER